MNAFTYDALAARAERVLSRFVDGRRVARHGLLAVADVGGAWSWQGAHGVADPTATPATVSTRYPIPSVTKIRTAVVVMQRVEQERVALQDRIVDLAHVVEVIATTEDVGDARRWRAVERRLVCGNALNPGISSSV